MIKYLHEKVFSTEEIQGEINPNEDMYRLYLLNIKYVVHRLQLVRTDILNPEHQGGLLNEEIRKEMEEKIY